MSLIEELSMVNQKKNTKSRSILFFASLGLALASLIALIVTLTADTSSAVPFDKNNGGGSLAYIEVNSITKLATGINNSNSGKRGTGNRPIIMHFYMITDGGNSQYIVRMSEDRAAELQNLPEPVTIYGRGERTDNNLPALYTSGVSGSYRNVMQPRPEFANWREFHETFGTWFLREGKMYNPIIYPMSIITLVTSVIVLLFNLPIKTKP